MNTNLRCFFFSTLPKFVLSIAAAATFFGPRAALAADALGYSFEAGLDGYAPNGGGITITQDSVGATQGTQSMKVAVVAGGSADPERDADRYEQDVERERERHLLTGGEQRR